MPFGLYGQLGRFGVGETVIYTHTHTPSNIETTSECVSSRGKRISRLDKNVSLEENRGIGMWNSVGNGQPLREDRGLTRDQD